MSGGSGVLFGGGPHLPLPVQQRADGRARRHAQLAQHLLGVVAGGVVAHSQAAGDLSIAEVCPVAAELPARDPHVTPLGGNRRPKLVLSHAR